MAATSRARAAAAAMAAMVQLRRLSALASEAWRSRWTSFSSFPCSSRKAVKRARAIPSLTRAIAARTRPWRRRRICRRASSNQSSAVRSTASAAEVRVGSLLTSARSRARSAG